MKKVSLALVLISLLSCKNDKTESVVDNLQTEINHKDTLEVKSESTENRAYNTNWQDDLISYYVRNSKNELIVSALKSKDNLDWQFDQTIKNDSTQFYIYKIGVHVTEEDGSNPRFSSCGWVYLDSVKRKLYEYDLPNDTIVEWKK
jgi:hypothetical protein